LIFVGLKLKVSKLRLFWLASMLGSLRSKRLGDPLESLSINWMLGMLLSIFLAEFRWLKFMVWTRLDEWYVGRVTESG
jgi:hypothetical protein